ncbi:MAG: NAD(P)-dependent oxidoreductase [Ilumatobacter sp.]|uniref:NAD(P)-dependent oxidoreductase n=1 Tax=Ilumatobacter sp. TaxID=1967498 RepID=UPI0026349E95|nr:NAD(P)-dependent oxidoreductase [Ilumatobacter sp.]MDJ0770622.1 NAD(P)-dependent oxidoreductase [Ilumatobacter sp.]
MSKPRVIVDPFPRTMSEIFSEPDLKRLHDLAEVVWGRDDVMPAGEFLEALPTADVVIAGAWRDHYTLDGAAALRAIIDVSGAFPLDLDIDRCQREHIRVLGVAPAFGRQVAEMGLALTLAVSRGVVQGDREFRHGTERYLHAGNTDTFLLHDQPVGFIGYGGISRALTELLAPFNTTISAYDPWLNDGLLRHHGVAPASLDEILTTSRIIYVTAVPTSQNEAMLSREKLELIRPDAVLVLLSRTHVIDFEAMTEMAAQGRFRVATDVVPTEPLAPDHPVRSVDGVVLSAHRAGSVREGLWEIGEMVCDDLEAILAGLPPARLQNAEPELFRRYASNTPPTLTSTQETD